MNRFAFVLAVLPVAVVAGPWRARSGARDARGRRAARRELAQTMKVLAVFPAFVVLAACGSSSPERARTVEQAIIAGADSDASQDAAVLLVHYDALSSDGSRSCTGTLLTPRLVLTARHCVAITDQSVGCGSKNDGAVFTNHDPKKLFVFTGQERPDLVSGSVNAARGVEILDDGARTLCNHDIALLLLDRDMPGAKIAPVRLAGGPAKKEELTVVGWGITDKTSSPPLRQQRPRVSVVAVGPDEVLGDAEFMTDEAVCSGDSGGPAFAASGAVVGVTSRGGNGTGEQGAEGCVNGIGVHTSTAGFESLILGAYEKAGHEPWREGEPNPRLAKVGAACGADAECRSNACNMQAMTCAQECASAACGTGQACADVDGRRLCVAAPEDDGGCAMSPRAPSRAGADGPVGVVLLLAGIALRIARARRLR